MSKIITAASINTIPSGENILVTLDEKAEGAELTLKTLMPVAVFNEIQKVAGEIASNTPRPAANPHVDFSGAISTALQAAFIKAHAADVPFQHIQAGTPAYSALQKIAAEKQSLGYGELVSGFKHVAKGSVHCAPEAAPTTTYATHPHMNTTGMVHHDPAAITNSAPQDVKYSKPIVESAAPHPDTVTANTFSAPSTTSEVGFSQTTVSAAPTTTGDAINLSAPVIGNVHHNQVTLPNSEIAGGAGFNSVSTTPVSPFSAPSNTAISTNPPVVGPHTAHVKGAQPPIAHVHHNLATGTGYSAPTGTGPIGHFTSSYANNVSAGERTP